MPSVNALYRDFKAAGLEVLLIDLREDSALVNRTVQERAISPKYCSIRVARWRANGMVSGSAYCVLR